MKKIFKSYICYFEKLFWMLESPSDWLLSWVNQSNISKFQKSWPNVGKKIWWYYLKNSSVSKENIFLDVVVVPTHKVSNNNNNGGHGNTGVWQRLSNKIKALELNVSITGRYLEELSVQYKKQIEDLTLAVGQSKDALLTGKYLKKKLFWWQMDHFSWRK